jgi:hypothetical protein
MRVKESTGRKAPSSFFATRWVVVVVLLTPCYLDLRPVFRLNNHAVPYQKNIPPRSPSDESAFSFLLSAAQTLTHTHTRVEHCCHSTYLVCFSLAPLSLALSSHPPSPNLV